MYKISNKGRLKGQNGNLMKISTKEYKSITLQHKNIQKTFLVHRLVAMSFLDIPKNHQEMFVNHLDRNKHNNYLYNLEWCTPSGNTLHWMIK